MRQQMIQEKQKTFYANQGGNPDDKAIVWVQQLATVAEIIKAKLETKMVQGEKRTTVKVRFRIF